MSLNAKTMIFDLIAKDHASTTFDKVGRSTTTSSRGMATWKKAALGGLAAVGTAAVLFAKKSIHSYQDVAKESAILSRLTGENVRDAGRLRFAAEESGVEFTTLSTSMKIFSKNTAAASGDSKKLALMTTQLGFSINDAHGKLLPMAQLLPKVADRFKHMPDGPQKTALAMKLFGKSGADMIKVLNKGSAGLKELGDAGEKSGNVLKNTDGYKAQLQAQREFHAAVTGLEVQLGAALYPVLTKVTEYLAQHVGPVFTSVSQFVSHHSQLIGTLTKILLPMIAGFVALVKVLRIFTAVMAAVNFVLDANPIGIVVLALAGLTAGFIYAYKHSQTFRIIVQAVFSAVGKAAGLMWTVIKTYFKFIIDTWLAVAGGIVNGAAKAFGWVPGLGPKLRTAAAWFNDFRHNVNDQLNGIHDRKVKITGDGSQLRSQIRTLDSLLNVFTNKQRTVKFNVVTPGMFNPGSGRVPHHARGTGYFAGGSTAINEEGRGEIIDLPRGSRIIPAGLSRSMAGHGDTYIVTVNGGLDSGDAIARSIIAALKGYKKRTGWQPLEFEGGFR